MIGIRFIIYLVLALIFFINCIALPLINRWFSVS